MIFKRIFDLFAVLFFLGILAIPMLVIALLIKLTSRGPVIYWSKRIGRDNKIFMMPKFRTMRTDTPELATHLLIDPEKWVTPVGKVLRAHSLDEIPQLWNILKGEMSFVGPRPALYNQEDLIGLRTKKGVHRITPGLTGWAQVNGRDHISIPEKVDYDHYYMENHDFLFDLRILLSTFFKVLKKEGVVH